jgi:hypothetical protein
MFDKSKAEKFHLQIYSKKDANSIVFQEIFPGIVEALHEWDFGDHRRRSSVNAFKPNKNKLIFFFKPGSKFTKLFRQILNFFYFERYLRVHLGNRYVIIFNINNINL